MCVNSEVFKINTPSPTGRRDNSALMMLKCSVLRQTLQNSESQISVDYYFPHNACASVCYQGRTKQIPRIPRSKLSKITAEPSRQINVLDLVLVKYDYLTSNNTVEHISTCREKRLCATVGAYSIQNKFKHLLVRNLKKE